MNKDSIELDKYRFLFTETKLSVIVETMFADKRTIENKDMNEMREFFRDLGKWEMLSETSRTMLQDLGIELKKEEQRKKPFRYGQYKMRYKKDKKDDRVVFVTISLTPEECLLRTEGNLTQLKLPCKDVEAKIKNVPKWKRFVNTVRLLKEI